MIELPLKLNQETFEFNLEIIFFFFFETETKNLIKLLEALKLLENNYLGGSGSRGSGQVSFKNITIVKRDVGYYTEDAEEDIIVENEDINGAINAL